MSNESMTSDGPAIEPVAFDDDYIDHPFIPSRRPQDVQAFLADFAAAQSEFEPVVRNRTVTIKPREAPAYSFTYAELANVLAATKALHVHGIAVSQPLHEDKQGTTWIYTIVAHKSGAGQVTRIKLGGANDIKAFGSEVTYLRRYCYAPAIGVASEDDADENGQESDSPTGEFRRDRQEEREPAQRRSAVRKSTPAPAPAPAASAAAENKVRSGQSKNLLLKIDSLGLAPDGPEVRAMLDRLKVSEISDDMLMREWSAVMNELLTLSKPA